MAIRIGVDLGGSKTEVIALDGDTEVYRQRQPTPAGDYQATLQTIVDLVCTLEATLAQQGTVGIATPGAISPATGRIKNSNSTCLIGQAVQQDLQHMLDRPVRMANDADCFALSEAVDGVASHASSVFGVILGTGTGGGIVVNGKLLTGYNAIAGEWGHNPLPWPQQNELPGPECYCGKQGCIETWLSGPALTADYKRHTGKNMTALDIVKSAEQGDKQSDFILCEYENRLARGLASVINIIDPQVIVLGGGLSNTQRLYKNVQAIWDEYVFSDRVDTQLLQAKHGDSSGVRGAAWLWD
ncbi:MAG TPA: ROK family protein [Gammaproteobacteria bacterium]|nr:ROK family protein [Gammaproteobacteria bacterium]